MSLRLSLSQLYVLILKVQIFRTMNVFFIVYFIKLSNKRKMILLIYYIIEHVQVMSVRSDIVFNQ